MSKRKSPHMTITVPQALRDDMTKLDWVNWSGVASRAFEEEVTRLAGIPVDSVRADFAAWVSSQAQKYGVEDRLILCVIASGR